MDVSKILEKINGVYASDLSNDEKYNVLRVLWTEYYTTCAKYHYDESVAYDFCMIHESDCYSIYQEPVRAKWSRDDYIMAFSKLGIAYEKDRGISYEDAIIILDWLVENARKNYDMLGIDIKTNSLNGMCEIGQVCSIMPAEKFGIKVTKNEASCFSFPLNHCFGTVTLPIESNGNVNDVSFIVDTTYRQFFSSVRCHEGRYYTYEENTGNPTAPDPGYFVTDNSFAKELMAKGYVPLNSDTAYLYGYPFMMSGVLLGQEKKNDINYLDAIKNSNLDYKINKWEMGDLLLDVPSFKRIG